MEVERRQNISFWIATELLAEEECIVETANVGVACVDMIEKADADYYKMILTDIQMPVMNGLDVAAIRIWIEKTQSLFLLLPCLQMLLQKILSTVSCRNDMHLSKLLDETK